MCTSITSYSRKWRRVNCLEFRTFRMLLFDLLRIAICAMIGQDSTSVIATTTQQDPQPPGSRSRIGDKSRQLPTPFNCGTTCWEVIISCFKNDGFVAQWARLYLPSGKLT